MIPVSESALGEILREGSASRLLFSKDAAGTTRFFIFSDDEAYKRFSESSGDPLKQHFLTTKGTWVFRLPIDEIDFVAIDATSPHEIAYGKELFPRLKQMANAIEVEEALLELRTSDTPGKGLIPLVRDYQGYNIAILKTGEASQLGLAPDDKGRVLLAVFTHDDGFDAYSAESKRLRPESEVMQMNLPGASLFDQITKIKIDGVVFNCCGPARPVAFAQQFAQVIINA